MSGADPYRELVDAVAAMTGFPAAVPLGGGRGPLARLLASRFPGKARRVATNLDLPELFAACGVVPAAPEAGGPGLIALPGTPRAAAAPATPPPAGAADRILVLPSPALLPAAERPGRFAAWRTACRGFAWSGPLCGAGLCGFLALADEPFARELTALGPQGGEFPDHGVGLERRCAEMLALWFSPAAAPPPAPPLPEDPTPWF